MPSENKQKELIDIILRKERFVWFYAWRLKCLLVFTHCCKFSGRPKRRRLWNLLVPAPPPHSADTPDYCSWCTSPDHSEIWRSTLRQKGQGYDLTGLPHLVAVRGARLKVTVRYGGAHCDRKVKVMTSQIWHIWLLLEVHVSRSLWDTAEHTATQRSRT